LLAANELSKQIKLLRTTAQHASDRLGFIVRKRALARLLAHDPLPGAAPPAGGAPAAAAAGTAGPAARFALRSDECPEKVRVGANSPNLWPTISSVTNTGICFWPL